LAKGIYPKRTINMNLRWQLIMVVALSLLLLSSCAINQTPQPLPTQAIPPETLRPLVVAAVSVDVGVGSPGLLEIVASGDWPDLCAQLAQVTSRIDGTEINISLFATAADPSCPPDYIGVPFRIAIPLNPVELPDGEYTATVNSVSTSFLWPQQ
jgi:hypothetical protein